MDVRLPADAAELTAFDQQLSADQRPPTAYWIVSGEGDLERILSRMIFAGAGPGVPVLPGGSRNLGGLSIFLYGFSDTDSFCRETTAFDHMGCVCYGNFGRSGGTFS
jgi:hypothetical protein